MSDEELDEKRADGGDERLGGFARFVLIAMAAVFVLSLGARAFLGEPSSGSDPDGANALVSPSSAGVTAGESTAEPDSFEALLPFFTEASFFGLIGFALGYAARKFVKVTLILVAVFFVGLQLLSYNEVVSIDWDKLIALLNDWILNLKENQTVTEVLKDRIPTTGAFATGAFLGYRRG